VKKNVFVITIIISVFLLVLSLRVPSGRVAAEYQFVTRIFFIYFFGGNQNKFWYIKIIIEIKFMNFICFLPNDDKKIYLTIISIR